MMVRAIADTIGGANRIETALLLSADDITGPASFDYLLQELAMTFDVHEAGVDREVRAFTEPLLVDFAAPVGSRRAYLFPFSDQVLYPLTMGARTVHTRLAIDPPPVSRLVSTLVHTGLARFAARERVRARLGRVRASRRPVDGAPYSLVVDVTHGSRGGRATLTGRTQADATAAGAASLVRSLVDGEVAEPGAWMPEQAVDPSRFFARLARSGLHVDLDCSAVPMGQTG